MRRLHIQHLTEYEFGTAVTLLAHRLMLRPREHHNVRVVASRLEISPTPVLRWERDVLDNSVAVATFGERTDRLRIESVVTIEHYEETPLDFWVDESAVLYPFRYGADQALDLAPYLRPIWPSEGPQLAAFLQRLAYHVAPLESFTLLDRLNRAIFASMRYQAREEPGVQSPSETLARGSGSCRDFAALFVDAARSLGIASRFVSGYLHTIPAFAGAGSTHAWAEAYLPGAGWKGFDPTGGMVTGDQHIAVAVARDARTVPPVAGSILSPVNVSAQLRVAVEVREERLL